MRLIAENVGMIRNADIKLDGLTVIAGENDTGKSTLGRLLFSLIQACGRYEQNLEKNKTGDIFELIERNFFMLRKVFDLEKFPEIRKHFYPPYFFRELVEANNSSSESIALIESKIDFLIKLKVSPETFDTLRELRELFFSDDTNKESFIRKSWLKSFRSEFLSELSPKGSDALSKIELLEGENILLKIALQNDGIKEFSFKDEPFLNDATLVETPVVLQMYDMIRLAAPAFGGKINRRTGIVAQHIEDLVLKLASATSYADPDSFADLADVLMEISAITNGGFTFEREKRSFYFKKDEGTQFQVINTATGLKSFGVIQLLIQAGVLNERSLLIIDEPEVHLHPKWQVAYAKLIVSLVKKNVPVLVTSHSPEIIQALKSFSEEQGLQNKTNFYLIESNGVVSDIEDVTQETNKILLKLAEPLHKLVWGR